MVFAGFQVDASDLYLEQQFQKVWNTEIDLHYLDGVQTEASSSDWIAKVEKLQAAIIEHAKVHEEGDYYPKLQSALSADQNATLTAEFAKHFMLVKQP